MKITEKQSTIAMVCVTIMYIVYSVITNNRTEQHQKDVQTIDSLRNEIRVRDAQIDDSYSQVIDLNNKINWLYDKYPNVHKEMFEDAAN